MLPPPLRPSLLQTFLNCAPLEGHSLGCDGGDVIDVVSYMAEKGLPDERCVMYALSADNNPPHVLFRAE